MEVQGKKDCINRVYKTRRLLTKSSYCITLVIESSQRFDPSIFIKFEIKENGQTCHLFLEGKIIFKK